MRIPDTLSLIVTICTTVIFGSLLLLFFVRYQSYETNKMYDRAYQSYDNQITQSSKYMGETK